MKRPEEGAVIFPVFQDQINIFKELKYTESIATAGRDGGSVEFASAEELQQEQIR